MKSCVYILIVILSINSVFGFKADTKNDIREEGRKFRVIGHDGKENRILSEFLETGMLCLRNLFIEGDESAGFPSLQEIDLGDFPVDNQTDLYSLKADVTNFKLYGLGNFTVNKVDLNIIGIIFDYDLEFHLTTSGEYANGDLKITDVLDVQGDGNLNLEIVYNPLGHAQIFPQTTTPPEWVIAIIEYYGFLLVRPDFHITGIMHDEELSSIISKQLSDIIEKYVGENAEVVSAQVSPIIMEKLNEWIQDYDSPFNKLIALAMDHCPVAKIFMDMLHAEAVKQGFLKNVV